MSTPIFKRKKISEGVRARMVEYYKYSRKNGYDPLISRQYAVHQEETKCQTSQGYFFREDSYKLPRAGRKRVWEYPYEETQRPLCDPKTYDKHVLLPLLSGINTNIDGILESILERNQDYGILRDALIDAGREDLVDLVD